MVSVATCGGVSFALAISSFVARLFLALADDIYVVHPPPFLNPQPGIKIPVVADAGLEPAIPGYGPGALPLG